MPRINIKGGVWRNTEDEILKAAVMKYGKNQWARIASLLHRKSDKQCKARWYEWLDPSVKKTEWSREEDEKLLHLAKLMPTQWRTIAPIVGRTANQCLERYEYLLDKAQNIDMSSRDDPRRLRPGEIDPTPETKPARPDPVDMDEDELEMLSEARARLANTQGKKAKRKARERQLEIARRMAMMQKRRELRAAGLASTIAPLVNKNVFIDYNREIPFEKQPPKGFHDTSREFPESKPINFDRLRLGDIEKEPFMEREKRERKKDAERQAKRLESDLPGALLAREKDNGEPVVKRSKLVLPAPQISDLELENLVKVGQAGENAMRMALEDSRSDAVATQTLLSEYHKGGGNDSTFATPLHLLAKTPQIGTDTIIQEAQNILALQQVQTPLKGGDNTELSTGVVNIVGATPQTRHLPTPNILLPNQLAANTPFRTPQVGATPGGANDVTNQTPRRDYLNINEAGGMEGPQTMTTTSLQKKLARLPQPKNNFEISMPDEAELDAAEQAEASDSATEGTSAHVADQAEVDREAAEARKAAADAAWAKRSRALQRGLPRPTFVNNAVLRPPPSTPAEEISLTDQQKAEELIKKEMLTMLHYDSLHNPPFTLLADLSRNTDGKLLSAVAQKKRLQQAAAAIEAETAVVRGAMGHGEVSGEAYARVWEECLAQVLHLPQHHRFTRANLVPKAERVSAAERRLEMLRGLMAEEAKKAARQEKRLSILLGGYQSRAQTLIKAIQESVEQIEQSQIELTSLEHLRQQEIGAIVRRTEMLKVDVERQRSRETQLQKTYAQMARLREDQVAGVEKFDENAPTPPLVSPRADAEVPEKDAQNDLGGWTTIQQSDEELVEEKNAGAQTDPVPLPEAIQVARGGGFSVDLDEET
uniref:Cell division cycle 5 protein n=1 Tax=Echinococcus granulosus TaxID=6210 RepID=A0A068WRY7_ECHGR|nr:cell division cycle 5 protein [Echinococcus granulosus]